MLDRDEDMLITGGRHPFFGHYKVRILHEYNLLMVVFTENGAHHYVRESKDIVVHGTYILQCIILDFITNELPGIWFCLILNCFKNYSFISPFFLLLWFVKVGFKKNGKVMALDVTYYSNAGNSLDLSLSVSIRSMTFMLSDITTYFMNII